MQIPVSQGSISHGIQFPDSPHASVRRILLQVFAPAHTPPDPELKPSHQQHVILWLETAWYSRKCLDLETDGPGLESQLCHMF